MQQVGEITRRSNRTSNMMYERGCILRLEASLCYLSKDFDEAASNFSNFISLVALWSLLRAQLST
jgi:hypothetical protein